MNTNDDLIDLGAASVETQGHPGLGVDLNIEGKPFGMSDED